MDGQKIFEARDMRGGGQVKNLRRKSRHFLRYVDGQSIFEAKDMRGGAS